MAMDGGSWVNSRGEGPSGVGLVVPSSDGTFSGPSSDIVRS